MDRLNTFTWLHISDFHAGMAGASGLWPQVKSKFFSDVKSFCEDQGSVDVVIFSGDITQRAAKKEFSKVKVLLTELWEVFDKVGCTPLLFLVPGNHDLKRPRPDHALVLAVEAFRTKAAIRKSIVDDSKGQYRKAISASFKEYTEFVAEIKSSSMLVPNLVDGLLPGDSSCTISVNGLNIGLVGLNTAWSQLEGGEKKGYLEIALEQLNSVVGNDAPDWTSKNNINFLVTHHPEDWLSKLGRKEFRDEINPPGFFDAHLYGHMHELNSVTYEYASGAKRRDIQAASLFGVEYSADGVIDRRHGYYYGRIDANSESLTIWPRKVENKEGRGGWDVSIDTDLTSGATDRASSTITVRNFSSEQKKKTESLNGSGSEIERLFSGSGVGGNLAKLKYDLPELLPYMDFRRIEVAQVSSSLMRSRFCWIVCEWNGGSDYFFAQVQERLNQKQSNLWCRIELRDYDGREEFLAKLNMVVGCDLASLCEEIKAQEKCFIVFDCVPKYKRTSPEEVCCGEVYDIAKVLMQHCSNLSIAVRSYQSPSLVGLEIVALKPLDEAACRNYIRLHPKCSHASDYDVESGAIYHYTSGQPDAIDHTLALLEFSTLEEMANEPSISRGGTLALAPPVLVEAIQRLAFLEKDEGSRLLPLLKGLVSFPFGEDMATIKQFYQDKPLDSSLARELQDLDFLEESIVHGIESKEEEKSKVIILRRDVQEYVRAQLAREEIRDLTEKAIAVYFGREWKLGKFKLSGSLSLDKHKFSSVVIQNAGYLILRNLHRAFDNGISEPRNLDLAVKLLSFYVAKLDAGNQFRHICNLCHDLFGYASRFHNLNSMSEIHFTYARSLRMLGSHRRSIENFEDVLTKNLSADMQARSYVNMAYSYLSESDFDEAGLMVDKVRQFKNKKMSVSHANTIALLISSDPDKIPKLRGLEIQARKSKQTLLANNIQRRIISVAASPARRQDMYKEAIAQTRRDKDIYNELKNIIDYSSLLIKNGGKLTGKGRVELLSAYKFSYGQRMFSLFEQSNEALWADFEKDKDVGSLINLYKYSSLLMRLSGNDEQEANYLRRLVDISESQSYSLSAENTGYLHSRSVDLGLVALGRKFVRLHS